MLSQMIVSSYARHFYILVLLPLLHLQIALSINPISWLLCFSFNVCRWTALNKHAAHGTKGPFLQLFRQHTPCWAIKKWLCRLVDKSVICFIVASRYYCILYSLKYKLFKTREKCDSSCNKNVYFRWKLTAVMIFDFLCFSLFANF